MQKMQETRIQSLGQEDALEKEMATHYSILAWKSPQTSEEPGGLHEVAKSRTLLGIHTLLLNIAWIKISLSYNRTISVFDLHKMKKNDRKLSSWKYL